MEEEKFSSNISGAVKKQFTDQLRAFKAHTSKKLQLLTDMADFIGERADIERKAAEKLLQSCVKTRNSDSFDDSVITRAVQAGGKVGAGLMTEAWSSLVEQSKLSAQSRAAAAQHMLDKTKQSIQELKIETDLNSKKVYEWIGALQIDFAETYKEVDSNYKDYVRDQTNSWKASMKLQKTQAKGGRAANKKEIGLKNDLDKAERKATQSRNEFLLSLAAANAVRDRYFKDELNDVLDALDFEFHDALRLIFKELNDATVNAAKGVISASDGLWQVAQILNKAAENKAFFNRNTVTMSSTPELNFTPCCDDPLSNVKLDFESEAMPRFRLLEQFMIAAENDIKSAQDQLTTLCRAGIKGKVGSLIGADNVDEPITLSVTAIAAAHSRAAIKRAGVLAQLRAIEGCCDESVQKSQIALSNGVKLIEIKGGIVWDKPTTGRFPPIEIDPVEFDSNGQRIIRVVSPIPGSRQMSFLGSENFDIPRAPPPCIGSNLIQFCKSTGDSIPLIVRSCLKFLGTEANMASEGIFRLSGSSAQIDIIKTAFDSGVDALLDPNNTSDINAVTGCLKSYFRELDDPVLTRELYPAWIKVAVIANTDHKLLAVREIVQHHLPIEHMRVLSVLLPFLYRISTYSKENMMSISNLAIVFGPTLLPAPKDDDAAMIRDGPQISQLVGFMIEHHSEVFEEHDSAVAKTVKEEKKPSEPICKVRAIFNYTARNGQEVSFQAGDVIDIYEKIDDNWWDGKLKGEQGFIAVAYVEEIHEEPKTEDASEVQTEEGKADELSSEDEADDDYLQIDAVPGKATSASAELAAAAAAVVHARPMTMFEPPRKANEATEVAAPRSNTMPSKEKPPSMAKAAVPEKDPETDFSPEQAYENVSDSSQPVAPTPKPAPKPSSRTPKPRTVPSPIPVSTAPTGTPPTSAPPTTAPPIEVKTEDHGPSVKAPAPPAGARPTPFVKPKPKKPAPPALSKKPPPPTVAKKPKPGPGIPPRPKTEDSKSDQEPSGPPPTAPPVGGPPSAPPSGPPSGPPSEPPAEPPSEGPPSGPPIGPPSVPITEGPPSGPPTDAPEIPPFDANDADDVDAPPFLPPPPGPPAEVPVQVVAARTPLDSFSDLPPPPSVQSVDDDDDFDALEDEDVFDPAPSLAPPPPPADYGGELGEPAAPPSVLVLDDSAPQVKLREKPEGSGGLVVPRGGAKRMSVGPSFAPPPPPPGQDSSES